VDERVAARLHASTYEAFRNLVQLCKDEQAEFLLIAGDVYDSEDRGIRAQVRFREGLAELAESGTETFIVHGNHDPLDGWQSAMSWPEGVHIFGPQPEWKAAIGRAGQRAEDGSVRPVAAIQGASYPTREVTENIALKFTPPPDRDIFSIGLLHCNVGGNPNHPNYAPCTVADLAQAGLDYWALGHVHTRQTLRDARRSGPPTVAYPGNLQGRHPGETGPRGCLVVHVGPDRVPRSEFRALDTVRWEAVDVTISGIKTLDGLVGAIRQAMDDLGVKADGRDVVCRVRLRGRGPMHTELRRLLAIAELLAAVRTDQALKSPWVWAERITDETRPEMDLAARSHQDDFLGAVLRHAAYSASHPDGVKRLSEAVSEVYNGRRGGLEAPTAAQVAEWSDEARWYLAELLAPEG